MTKNKISIHRYSIVYDPLVEVSIVRQELCSKLLDNLKRKYLTHIFVSDGASILFSSGKIDHIENIQLNHTYKRQETLYDIRVEFNKSLEISQEKIKEDLNDIKTALEIIFKNSVSNVLRYGSTCLDVQHLESQQYQSREDTYYHIVHGWREHVLPSPLSGIYLNIDLSTSAVISKTPLVELVQKIIGTHSRIEELTENSYSLTRVSDILHGIKVKCTHNNITKKIHSLVQDTSMTFKFNWDNNGISTLLNVQDYFDQRYQKRLTKPHYPLVQLVPASKKIFVPMEFLCVEVVQRLANVEQEVIAHIVKEAAIPPHVRYRNTIKRVEDSFSERGNIVTNQFGFSVSPSMTYVDGSYLLPPKILYQLTNKIPMKGGFRPSDNDLYFKGSIITSLLVCDFTNSNEPLKIFMNALNAEARRRGVRISQPRLINVRTRALDNSSELKSVFNGNHSIIIAVVPNQVSTMQYRNIKSVCDLELGIISQVLKIQTVRKESKVAGNILLKINAKMGGINQNVEIPNELSTVISNGPFMVMGADVTHTMSGIRDSTSISLASVVSSIDKDACIYTNQVAINKRGSDIIEDFGSITREALQRYRTATGGLPARIIMFRDGLSEGQFLIARQIELESMIKIFEGKKYQPKITFVCVQKRHHTRLYRDEKDAQSDIHPGLFVSDRKICDEKTFYLLSHAKCQGTAKSGQYKIILDQNNFSLPQLAQFAYCLCHNFARCSSSISIPSPVFYAHLCAFRTNHHKNFQESQKHPDIIRAKDQINVKDENFESEFTKFAAITKRTVTPHINLQNSMYFA